MEPQILLKCFTKRSMELSGNSMERFDQNRIQWALRRYFEWHHYTYWIMPKLNVGYANIDNKAETAETDKQKGKGCLSSYGNENDTNSSMLLHKKVSWNSMGLRLFPISMTPIVYQNSMEQQIFRCRLNSMEFYRTIGVTKMKNRK